ncbi:MAG: hypothetical protein V1708_02030 [Candidatus Micrarchaeota archaeon]
MSTHSYFLLLLIPFLLFSGCVKQTEIVKTFVCSDGTEVSAKSLCPTPTALPTITIEPTEVATVSPFKLNQIKDKHAEFSPNDLEQLILTKDELPSDIVQVKSDSGLIQDVLAYALGSNEYANELQKNGWEANYRVHYVMYEESGSIETIKIPVKDVDISLSGYGQLNTTWFDSKAEKEKKEIADMPDKLRLAPTALFSVDTIGAKSYIAKATYADKLVYQGVFREKNVVVNLQITGKPRLVNDAEVISYAMKIYEKIRDG